LGEALQDRNQKPVIPMLANVTLSLFSFFILSLALSAERNAPRASLKHNKNQNSQINNSFVIAKLSDGHEVQPTY
jgi:hypothetical protein